MTRRLLDTTGKRIKALRADLGLSQTDVSTRAKNAGFRPISQTRLSEAENNDEKSLGGDILKSLAFCLETSVDYLLCLTDDPSPIRGKTTHYISAEADRIATMIDRIVDENRRAELEIVVRAMVESQERERRKIEDETLRVLETILRRHIDTDSAKGILLDVQSVLRNGQ